jgi:hypothetical protein
MKRVKMQQKIFGLGLCILAQRFNPTLTKANFIIIQHYAKSV